MSDTVKLVTDLKTYTGTLSGDTGLDYPLVKGGFLVTLPREYTDIMAAKWVSMTGSEADVTYLS